MSELMLRAPAPAVTPAEAGWRWLSYRSERVDRQRRDSHRADEVCLVNLGGALAAVDRRRAPQPGRAESPFADLPRSLYLPPGHDVHGGGRGDGGRVRRPRRVRPPGAADPARAGACGGARVRQRHPPDQPHRPAGVPRPPAAGGRGADAGRELVVVSAAQARAGPAAGRERPRRGVRLPVRAARGVRRAAPVQPHRRSGRDVDGARRRRAARAARVSPVLLGPRVSRLLPERPRCREAIDGGRGRPRPGLDAGYLAARWSAIRASP